MIQTRRTDERFTIRALLDQREGGLSLAISFFKGTIVTDEDIGRIYAGLEIEEDKWTIVKTVLAERMTKD